MFTQMAKDAYWFRHDANARNDIKVIELRSIHGYQGYGLYFATLEVMREQSHYCIPENKIGMLAVALGESTDKVREIIKDCIAVGLFTCENGMIYSVSFLARMSKWEEQKTRNETNGAKGGRPKGNPQQNPTNNPNKTQNKPIRGEERRIEESIEENREKTVPRKRFAAPSFEQVYSIMLNRRETELFMAYYESNGWKVGKNMMKDWTKAVTGWKLRGNVQPDSERAQYENYGDSIG